MDSCFECHLRLAFDTCRVGSYGKNPKVKNLTEANKAMTKSLPDKLSFFFSDLENPVHLTDLVYGTATRTNVLSGASQGAHMGYSNYMEIEKIKIDRPKLQWYQKY